MSNFFHIILELIFPPDKNEGSLRELSCITLYTHCETAEEIEEPYINSVFSYRDEKIKKLVLSLKYQAHPHAINIIAEVLSDELMEILQDVQYLGYFKAPLLVPIPMHNKKRRERGWNQCDLLVKKIHKISRIPMELKLLKRSRYTPSQTSMNSKKERLQNPKGSFKVSDKNKVKGKDIILIDDVLTTGATLCEARKTLLKAGAHQVIALTFAH